MQDDTFKVQAEGKALENFVVTLQRAFMIESIPDLFLQLSIIFGVFPNGHLRFFIMSSNMLATPPAFRLSWIILILAMASPRKRILHSM